MQGIAKVRAELRTDGVEDCIRTSPVSEVEVATVQSTIATTDRAQSNSKTADFWQRLKQFCLEETKFLKTKCVMPFNAKNPRQSPTLQKYSDNFCYRDIFMYKIDENPEKRSF